MSEARRLFAIAWSERDVLFRAIRRHGVSPRDADDVAQNAMCDVWKHLVWGLYAAPEGMDERVALRRWLNGIGRIAAFQHHSRRKPTEPLTDDVPGRDLAAQIEARETVRILFYRLNRVETSLVNGLAQGETLIEAGKRMRMPWPTVSTKVRAVRRVLRQRLARLR